MELGVNSRFCFLRTLPCRQRYLKASVAAFAAVFFIAVELSLLRGRRKMPAGLDTLGSFVSGLVVSPVRLHLCSLVSKASSIFLFHFRSCSSSCTP